MTIQDYQGFVRWQGGLQDRPESDFESVFQMSQGGVLKDYDDESGCYDVDNDDYNYDNNDNNNYDENEENNDKTHTGGRQKVVVGILV